MRFSRPAERPLGLPGHPGDGCPDVLAFKHLAAPGIARSSRRQKPPCASLTTGEPSTELPRHRKKRGPAYKISSRSHPHAFTCIRQAAHRDPTRCAAIGATKRARRRRWSWRHGHFRSSPAPSPAYSREPKTTARVREELTRAVAHVARRPIELLLGGHGGRRGRIRRGGVTGRGARTRPLDAVLDDPALERVTGDAEELSGFDDASGGRQGFHAKQSFSSVEVPVFEDEAHGGRVGENHWAGKAEIVRALYKNTRV